MKNAYLWRINGLRLILESLPVQPILRRALAAFTYRDFRLLWFGAFTSTVGTWMQKVAQSWLILELTKSAFYLGLDDFLGSCRSCC